MNKVRRQRGGSVYVPVDVYDRNHGSVLVGWCYSASSVLYDDTTPVTSGVYLPIQVREGVVLGKKGVVLGRGGVEGVRPQIYCSSRRWLWLEFEQRFATSFLVSLCQTQKRIGFRRGLFMLPPWYFLFSSVGLLVCSIPEPASSPTLSMFFEPIAMDCWTNSGTNFGDTSGVFTHMVNIGPKRQNGEVGEEGWLKIIESTSRVELSGSWALPQFLLYFCIHNLCYCKIWLSQTLSTFCHGKMFSLFP